MTATTEPRSLSAEELFRQHAPFVARLLMRLGLAADQVDDTLQEVFLVAHRHGGYRPGVAKPTSYLAGIAIHAASKRRRRDRIDRARRAEASWDQLASTQPDVLRTIQVQQDLDRLQLALDRLPDELKTTLVLVEIEGESCLSVAAAMGLPVGTVYSRLHRAHKKLQAALRVVDGARADARRARDAREKRRAIGVPSMGMLMFLGSGPAFQRSEAGRLVQLARVTAHPTHVPEAQLARHLELVRSGADLPAWGASHAPPAWTWLSTIGVGHLAAAAAVLGVAAVAIFFDASPASHTTQIAPQASRGPSPSATPAAAAHEGDETEPGAQSEQRADVASPVAPPVPTRTDRPAAPRERRARTRSASEAQEARQRANLVRDPEDADALQPSAASPALPPAGPDDGEAVTSVFTRSAPESHAAKAATHRAQPAERHPSSADAQPPPRPKSAARVSTDPAAAPAGERASDAALDEMKEVARAERSLRDDPARALEIVRRLRASHPTGYLREESAYLEVMALARLGRNTEARTKAEAFLNAHPDSPYVTRVSSALAGGARP